MVSIIAILSPPALSQEKEEESILIESTITEDVDPLEAVTVEDLKIPVDQLELLVKPLSLEELQTESAAWFLLLKDKAVEISTAEIAIKRENQIIKEGEEADKAVSKAKEELSKAESALNETTSGTPEYEKAVQQVEAAKQALREAQQYLKEALETERELKQDEELEETLQEAKLEEQITSAQEIFEEAEKEIAKLTQGSAAYNEGMQKIDVLAKALLELESAEKELENAVPDSPEYKQLETTVAQQRTQVIQATKAVSDAGLAPLAKEEEFAQDDKESETELKNQLVVNVTNLQGEQTAIIDRFNVVLDALENKGGETKSYRKYIDVVSGIELNVTDTEGLGVRLVSWLQSEEGGVRWGVNLAKLFSILVASIIVSQILASLTNKLLSRFGNTSSLFRGFLVIIVKRGVFVVGGFLALATIGINLGPILALVGGASFILAFSLQSNLGNVASGLMLLINKPFDVGDEVKVAGYWAYVDSISLASTKLKDFAGSIVTLPNNTVWGSDIINLTHSDIRSLSLPIHIKFEEDIEMVISMWKDLASSHPKVLDTPAPSAFCYNSHYNYYISVGLKAWTATEGYWGVYSELLKALQQRILELDIELAIPQQDIRVHPSQLPEIATKQGVFEDR
ncbi:MAG: mechanosensitive ion channel domain-containing protein [Crocosphaera sp.]